MLKKTIKISLTFIATLPVLLMCIFFFRFFLFTGYLKITNFSGEYAVVKNQKLLHASTPINNPMPDGRLFMVDSSQKVITASLIEKAIREGKLSLNSHLSDFFPNFSYTKQITINEMLQMKSGLIFDQKIYPPIISANDYQIGVWALQKAAFKNQGHFRYEPINYLLLAGILSNIYHRSYSTLVKDEIIKPQKLKETKFIKSENNGLIGSITDNDSSINASSMRSELGTGNIASTAKDYALLSNYLYTNNFLSKKFRNNIESPQNSMNYFGGVYHVDFGLKAHGVGYGYESYVLISRSKEKSVVLFSNQSIPKRVLKIATLELSL